MPLSPPVSRQLRHRRAIHAVAYERDDGLWDVEACLTDHKSRDVPLATGIVPSGMPIHELWLRITIDRKLNIVDAEASTEWAPYAGECRAANSAYRALVGLNLLRQFRREANRLLAGTVGCTHLTELCGVLPTAAIQAFAGDVWDTTSSSGPGENASMAKTTPKTASEARATTAANAEPKVGQTGQEPDSRATCDATSADTAPPSGPEPGGHRATGDASSAHATATNAAPGTAQPGDATPPVNTNADAAPPFQLGRCHALRFEGEAVRQFYPRWYGRVPRSLAREGANGATRQATGPGGAQNGPDDGSKSTAPGAPVRPQANQQGTPPGAPHGQPGPQRNVPQTPPQRASHAPYASYAPRTSGTHNRPDHHADDG